MSIHTDNVKHESISIRVLLNNKTVLFVFPEISYYFAGFFSNISGNQQYFRKSPEIFPDISYSTTGKPF